MNGGLPCARSCRASARPEAAQSAALPASGTTLTLPTAGLATGIYLVRLHAGDTTVTKRLTIE
ncbi:T9SS type A sorting domain-containing protein [Hymenobacter psoromatis]|uniref:T9SS type A sorting domain-containing protein n=1 Tax=Hymenobacter psoromatis TaxID=1484116 RepID=UPI001CBC9850|nr:T9SS type A sorting domain-containing protein [Hymenobacter psoromatis]